jgi:hypothetical protein
MSLGKTVPDVLKALGSFEMPGTIHPVTSIQKTWIWKYYTSIEL